MTAPALAEIASRALDGKRVNMVMTVIIGVFLAQAVPNPTIRGVQDEPWVSVPAYTLITQGVLSLQPMNWDEKPAAWPPLLQLCLAGIYKLFGFGLVQGRALMMFFGTAALILAFLVARDLFDDATALLAAAFLAVDNLFFLAARTIRAEILVVFLILLAFYLTLQGVRKKRGIFLFLAGLSSAAAMSTHPHGFLGLVAVLLFLPMTEGFKTFRRPDPYLFLAGAFTGSLPFIIYLLAVDLPNGFAAFKSQVLRSAPALAKSGWLLESFQKELSLRYQRFMLPPYRVHIGVMAVAAVVCGLVLKDKKRRYLSGAILTYLVLFVLLMSVQKNVRYFVLISPLLSLLVASVLIALMRGTLINRLKETRPDGRAGRMIRTAIVLLLAALWGGSQLVGNVIYHVQHKDTKYYEFTDRLKAVMPADASVYSIITFWFAFTDRPFYSYNKVSWEDALTRYHPRILLLDDTYMMNGDYETHNWSALRQTLFEYVQKNGKLLGIVSNWFYGDVKVYEVTY